MEKTAFANSVVCILEEELSISFRLAFVSAYASGLPERPGWLARTPPGKSPRQRREKMKAMFHV